MIKNILLTCQNWLIKFIGGYTEMDLILAKAELRLAYLEDLARVQKRLKKAEANYQKATERIRHMLILEARGYAKTNMEEAMAEAMDRFLESWGSSDEVSAYTDRSQLHKIFHSKGEA